jgi:hypothetical protein
MSKLLAPNGKPSNLNPEQYKLVRTPAFKKWFGDWDNDSNNASKVVDKNGEPLVVYHGSPANFNIFEEKPKQIGRRKLSIKGHYFSISKWAARQYAGSDGYVKQYFLRIINFPKKTDNVVSDYSNIDDFLFDYGKTIIEKFNYDGAIDEIGDFIVFNSNQIKLADGTNTTFDSNNPDIRYGHGGKVKTYWYKGLFQSNYFEKLDNYKAGGNIDKEYNDYVKRVYDLAVFNSKLVKGYKNYKSDKDEQDYEEKNKELKKLVDIAIKNNYEVHRNSDVIYFVIDGIQISFHYPSGFRNQGVTSFNELPNENKYEWDGVKNAYKYSKEEYEKLKKDRAEILNIRKLYKEELKNEFIEEGNKLINYYNKNLKRTKNPKTREYYEDKIEDIRYMIEGRNPSPYKMNRNYQLYNEKNIYFGEIGKELERIYKDDYILEFSLG